MTILTVGSTGNIGSQVVRELASRGATVRALVKDDPAKVDLPPGVEAVQGDTMDPDSMRAALEGATSLFLLNPVAPNELAMALLTLDLAREAGVRGVVYFSMLNADRFLDCPHSAAKFAAEQAIAHLGLPATILRPSYFFQNDAMSKDALVSGVYPMPIGGVGVEMVDIRDIAEVAALELLKREQCAEQPPREIVKIVGPEAFTGSSIAALWSDVLGREVAYAGDDLAAFEERFRAKAPAWMAHDNALMFRGFHRDGMRGAPGAAERLSTLLGRPLRRYRAFAEEQAAQWGRPERTSAAA